MKKSYFGRFALISAVALLSGCGAWDSLFEESDEVVDEATEEAEEEVISTFDDQIVESLDFIRMREDLETTAPANMPTTGSAEYAGVAGFTYDTPATGVEDYDVMADVALTADFESGDVTGSFDNFNRSDDVDMDGELTVTEGAITDAALSGNAIGSFVDGEEAELWDLELNGTFMGDHGEYAYGTADGTATNGGADSTNVYGEFTVGQ